MTHQARTACLPLGDRARRAVARAICRQGWTRCHVEADRLRFAPEDSRRVGKVALGAALDASEAGRDDMETAAKAIAAEAMRFDDGQGGDPRADFAGSGEGPAGPAG